MRAAVAESAAQSLPLYALGARAGAAEAIQQFEAVTDRLLDAATPASAAVGEAPTSPGIVDPIAVAGAAGPASTTESTAPPAWVTAQAEER